jgi:TatD DNase family protein
VLGLVDTHAHLDELENLDFILEEARKNGIIAIVAVGTDYESNVKILEISQKYPSFVYPALGLHPWQLADINPSQIEKNLNFIEQYVATAVAIGEIGLDYQKQLVKLASRQWQKDVLQRLLELARKYDKPISIHSRYAWKDTFQLVKDAGIKKAVFHWFTGFSSTLKEIIDAGYFVSATPATEYHEEHRRAVRETPVDKLLLETDSPVTYGRELKYKAKPSDVLRSLRAVTQLKELDEAMVAEQTTRNAIQLFGLDSPKKVIGKEC